MATNNVFWNQLLMRSDSIMDINPDAADAAEQVLAQLNTVSEQFDRVFDPADQFEEYVAVALCQALQRALTPQKMAPVCKVSVQNKIPATPGKAVSLQDPEPTKKSKVAKAAGTGKKNNAKSSKKLSGGGNHRNKTG